MPGWHPLIEDEMDKGHGRIEKRRASLLWELGQVTDASAWPGLRCIVKMRSERSKGEDRMVDDRYYISMMHTPRATELAWAVRLHWGVENGLHWRLDMTFGEDSRRVRV
jgi:hypothetical protein